MKLKGEADVLIVGAGPVGLFAALGLAERGVDVRIIDKEWRGAAHSYALALHPQTLELLDRYGVTPDLLRVGHRVERVCVHDGDEEVAKIDLSTLDGPHKYILVVPQSVLEQTLEKRLEEKKVQVFWNHQALGLEETSAGVTARIGRMEKYSMGYPVARTEWMIAKEIPTSARFVIGADGYHSFVRKWLDVAYEHVGEAEAFSVFEFPADLEHPEQTHMVFRDGTTNVLWPMGPDRGRWSFQVDPQSAAAPRVDGLKKLMAARAPWFSTSVEEVAWSTTVLFERRLADRFGRDHVWLAGDAGHITGPAGSQSMNVGLREANDLGGLMATLLKGGSGSDILERYNEQRRAEWQGLLGVGGVPQSVGGSRGWTHEQAAKILPCMPASGDDLTKMLQQVGLQLA